MYKFFTVLLLLFMVSCQSPAPTAKPYPKGSFGYDLDFLRRHDSIVVLQRGEAALALSPKYQAKVFTSTAAGLEGLSFGWIHYAAFDGPLDTHMNAYGGENRCWLGPEGGPFALFFTPGSKMEFAGWHTPAAFDSEPWSLVEQSDSAATCRKVMELTNYKGSVLQLRVDRTVTLLDSTAIKVWLGIRAVAGVRGVGYGTANTLTNTGSFDWDEKRGMPCLWILDMFPPSTQTTIAIPFRGDSAAKPATTDYFGAIPPDRLRIIDSVLYFKADGRSRGKLGIHPAAAQDKAGSYDAAAGVLTIILYDHDPMGHYLNQQWRPDVAPFTGDAMNAYNDGPLADGKQMGPFYELESVSPAAFLPPGHSMIHRHSVFHFTGDEAGLDYICRQTLGVSLNQLKTVF
jgi:hypothetical protein